MTKLSVLFEFPFTNVPIFFWNSHCRSNLKHWGSLLNQVGVGLLKECRIPSKGAALCRQMWLSGCLTGRSLTFADSAVYSGAIVEKARRPKPCHQP